MKPKKYCLEVSFVDHHPQISLFWPIYSPIYRDDFLQSIRTLFTAKDPFYKKLDQRPEYLLREAIKHEA